MSSHHIIREKQEPALLVLGLDNFADDLLGQLLEWSPTLMVTADTAEQLNAFGIKFDVLIGDDGEGNLQSDIKYISRGSGTIAQAALNYLTANNYPAVNIITDELLLSDYLPFAGGINIVIFNQNKKIYPVLNGFTKWKPAGDVIEIMSEADGLTFTGLALTGNNLYKTTHDGFFTLRFNTPSVFIAESIA
ncbi:thiamine pyrophosphokinase [Mucilaginibacter gracilis]|uniref:Thiamine pyrophosphokinase n=1 Tax=Mucilaginibacter gracilis TaxID=423350 RepID=A0A495IZQ4_9SPHI|nr:thiamine pyrophosphokinase [Mucilaginibacter gracilis]RKR81514.1 thiamine pyrophosphokinase [Mucilaginibacter gracilis]